MGVDFSRGNTTKPTGTAQPPMGNTTAMSVYVCPNPDCPWVERERQVSVSQGAPINVGQGLLIYPAVVCECGTVLDPQPVSSRG